jgi:flagellar protein FlgJ
MDVSTLSLHPARGPAVPLEQLQRNPRLSEKEKVEESARQFEAVLLRQILAQARKTVIKSDDQGESSSTEIYQDMINQQLAEAMSQSGSFGLAESLKGQLTRQMLLPAGTPGVTDPRAVSGERATSSFQAHD